MTCIVGVTADGSVWMGADSASYADRHRGGPVRTPKLYYTRAGQERLLIGFTSSWRMGELLAYSLKPEPRGRMGLERWMATKFIDAVRACLKDGGFAKKTDETEKGGNFLVGVAGRLFEVGEGYGVIESCYGYDACGSGVDFAKGALLASVGERAEGRVRLALRAAERHCATVDGPFRVKVLRASG